MTNEIHSDQNIVTAEQIYDICLLTRSISFFFRKIEWISVATRKFVDVATVQRKVTKEFAQPITMSLDKLSHDRIPL